MKSLTVFLSYPLKDLGRKTHGEEETQDGPDSPQIWRAGGNFCPHPWEDTELTDVWLGSFPEHWPGLGEMALKADMRPNI